MITFPVTVTDVLLECPHYPQFCRQCGLQSSLSSVLSESPTAVKRLLLFLNLAGIIRYALFVPLTLQAAAYGT